MTKYIQKTQKIFQLNYHYRINAVTQICLWDVDLDFEIQIVILTSSEVKVGENGVKLFIPDAKTRRDVNTLRCLNGLKECFGLLILKNWILKWIPLRHNFQPLLPVQFLII